MKTESTVKYVLRLALTLLAITAVVAVILAGVNSVTAPRIAELNAEKTQAAIEAVLPGGGEEVAFTDDTGLVTTAYKGDAGYAIQVAPSGFNGAVTMMVGVDNDGNEFTLMDVLAAGEDSVFKQAETSILRTSLLKLVHTRLTEREQKIILMRLDIYLVMD